MTTEGDPKISIVTVNLNGGAILERAIRSIVEQKYSNIDYVLIDGGSTDDSLEIIDRYRDRIQSFVSEPDHGISHAFNKGIKLCQGVLIGIVSADDYLEPGALRAVADCYVQNNKPDVIYGDAGWLEHGVKKFVRPDPLNLIWHHQPLKHPSVFVRSDAYGRFGLFDENLRYAMDYELLFRFFRAGAKFTYLPKAITTISSGGVNQIHLLKTIHEVKESSIRHGTTRWQAEKVYWGKVAKWVLRSTLERLHLPGVIQKWRNRTGRYY